MKIVLAVPLATLALGLSSLWLSSGALLHARERDLCWLSPSCVKL